MKTKLISILSVACMLFVTSCEPTEDRLVLDNSFDPNVPLDLSYEYFDGVDGSNKITLKMNTPGVMGTWNYGVGVKQSDVVTFTYPAAGTATFTFNIENQYIDADGKVTSGYSQSIEVPITNMNVKLDDAYYNLCGEDTAAGKVWVFEADDPTTGGPWYGNGPTDPAAYETVWWQPGADTCPELAGEMKFDLNGGAFITKTPTPGAAEEKGTFMFNADYSKISTKGTTILGAAVWEPFAVELDVCKLDESVLYLHHSNYCGNGWTWRFKVKE